MHSYETYKPGVERSKETDKGVEVIDASGELSHRVCEVMKGRPFRDLQSSKVINEELADFITKCELRSENKIVTGVVLVVRCF